MHNANGVDCLHCQGRYSSHVKDRRKGGVPVGRLFYVITELAAKVHILLTPLKKL